MAIPRPYTDIRNTSGTCWTLSTNQGRSINLRLPDFQYILSTYSRTPYVILKNYNWPPWGQRSLGSLRYHGFQYIAFTWRRQTEKVTPRPTYQVHAADLACVDFSATTRRLSFWDSSSIIMAGGGSNVFLWFYHPPPAFIPWSNPPLLFLWGNVSSAWFVMRWTRGQLSTCQQGGLWRLSTLGFLQSC
jgi:hypothetical protein